MRRIIQKYREPGDDVRGYTFARNEIFYSRLIKLYALYAVCHRAGGALVPADRFIRYWPRNISNNSLVQCLQR